MGTLAGRARAHIDDGRDESPNLEVVRRILRVLLVVSLALTVLTVIFPLATFVPATVAIVCYVALLGVTWAERRGWHARHDVERRGHGEVGLRVVAGGEGAEDVDTGDATVDSEPRAAHARPLAATAPTVERGGDPELLSRPQQAGLNVMLVILTVLAILAFVVAAAVFDTRLLGVGAVLAFAYMALFGASVWLASVEDAAEDRRARGLGRP